MIAIKSHWDWGKDPKKLRQISVVVFAFGAFFLFLLAMNFPGVSRGKTSVATLSRLSYLQSLIGSLRTPAEKTRSYKMAITDVRELRALYAFDFENLRYEIQELRLEEHPAWQSFSEAWKNTQSERNVSEVRIALTEPTINLTKLVTSRSESSSTPWTPLRVFGVLGALSLTGFGYGLLRHTAVDMKLKTKVANLHEAQKEIELELARETRNFNLVHTALKVPVHELGKSVHTISSLLATAEDSLNKPSETMLFDSPEFEERKNFALEKIQTAQHEIKLAKTQHEILSQLTDELVTFDPKVNQVGDDIVVSDVFDVIGEAVTAVSASDELVTIEYVLRTDSPLGDANKDALSVVVSNMLLSMTHAARSAATQDKRVLVSLWDASVFWNKFQTHEIFNPAKVRIEDINAVQDRPGFVLVFANSIQSTEMDLLQQLFEDGNDAESRLKENPNALRLCFVKEVLKDHKAMVWLTHDSVEPGYSPSQFAVFWPF